VNIQDEAKLMKDVKHKFKDFNVIYIDDKNNIEKNKSFFKSIFRKLFIVESNLDKILLNDSTDNVDLIIINSTVNQERGEEIVRAYLQEENQSVEILMLVDKTKEMSDILNLFDLGVSTFINQEYDKKNFLSSMDNVSNHIGFKKEEAKKIEKKKEKLPKDLGFSILESSIPTYNMLKNFLIKNKVEGRNITNNRCPEEFINHIQKNKDNIDIVIIGKHEDNIDIYDIVKNVFNAKKELYIIVISETSDKEIIQELLKYGVKDVFLKPFEENIISKKIQAATTMGSVRSLGLNKYLYNIAEIVGEYRSFSFNRKLNNGDDMLLKGFISFLKDGKL